MEFALARCKKADDENLLCDEAPRFATGYRESVHSQKRQDGTVQRMW